MEERILKSALSYFRIALGINIFLHGAVRLGPNYSSFVQTVSSSFEVLPSALSLPALVISYLIVPWELIVGFLLILGWQTHKALFMGFVLMVILMSGTCLLQNWSNAALQLNYIFFYAVLLALIPSDEPLPYSLDLYLKN